MIKGTTKLLGVIGDPIRHSLSPVMHNAAIAHLGVDYVYLPFPVKAQDLKLVLDGFAAIGLVGFNVTIPHKQAIFPFLTEVSELAQAVGAVNTVWRTEQGWAGTNTDVDGFLAPLRQLDQESWQQKCAVILGTGGAARAVVAGCAALGLGQVHVVGRNLEKLTAFQHSWQHSWQHSSGFVIPQVHPWETLPDWVAQADLLVNTTPVGMAPDLEQSPVEPTVMQNFKPGAIAYDLIYTPNPTQFLKLAQAQGSTTINGLEMLVQQGAQALEIWLNQPAPVEIMTHALRSWGVGSRE
ncbi:MAG: shikimate dehydrogenase [Microcoleaceae cyanobacterium]